MEIISKVGDDSKIAIFKKMIAMRSSPNYHFMPEWVIELQFSVRDMYMALGFLLKENWGVHVPQTGKRLVQTHVINIDEVTYEVVLYKDDAGFKGIYLMVTDRRLGNTTKTMYIASTGYYSHWCNGLEEGLYTFVKPMYRQGDVRPSKWHYSLEEACK